jgi:hypothetical protein
MMEDNVMDGNGLISDKSRSTDLFDNKMKRERIVASFDYLPK